MVEDTSGEIIEYLKQNGPASSEVIAKQLGISVTMVNRKSGRLLEKGDVVRVGKHPNVKYALTQAVVGQSNQPASQPEDKDNQGASSPANQPLPQSGPDMVKAEETPIKKDPSVVVITQAPTLEVSTSTAIASTVAEAPKPQNFQTQALQERLDELSKQNQLQSEQIKALQQEKEQAHLDDLKQETVAGQAKDASENSKDKVPSSWFELLGKRHDKIHRFLNPAYQAWYTKKTSGQFTNPLWEYYQRIYDALVWVLAFLSALFLNGIKDFVSRIVLLVLLCAAVGILGYQIYHFQTDTRNRGIQNELPQTKQELAQAKEQLALSQQQLKEELSKEQMQQNNAQEQFKRQLSQQQEEQNHLQEQIKVLKQQLQSKEEERAVDYNALAHPIANFGNTVGFVKGFFNKPKDLAQASSNQVLKEDEGKIKIQQENQNLQKQVDQLHNQNKELQQQIASKDIQIKELELKGQSNNAQVQDFAGVQNQMKQTKEELSKSNDNLQKANQENERLKNSLLSEEGINDDLSRKLKAALIAKDKGSTKHVLSVGFDENGQMIKP